MHTPHPSPAPRAYLVTLRVVCDPEDSNPGGWDWYTLLDTPAEVIACEPTQTPPGGSDAV